MKDLTLCYYDAKMCYLRDAAKEFAATQPNRAAMLNLDHAGVPDFFVERLVEVFAFSVRRLRKKIDDDLHKLTEGLVSMLGPHYTRSISSLWVVTVVKIVQQVPAP